MSIAALFIQKVATKSPSPSILNKSTYANISEAVAEASMDSLAIVSIFIQEQSEFDQFRVRDSEAIYNLRMAALKLSQAHAGPTVRSVELSINLGDFTNSVR